MGWTGTHRPKGQPLREFFEGEGFDPARIVDFAVKHRTTAYVAYRMPDTEEIAAYVILIRYSRDYFNITYKDMHEMMGPNESECPERILDLLDPTDNDYANEWRARCRKNIAIRRSVKKGTEVRFVTPIEFSNGVTMQTLVYSGKGNTFHDPAGPEYGRYRVSGWTGLVSLDSAAA
jgi:hypothetical protein